MIAGYSDPEVLDALPKAKSWPASSETSCTSLSAGTTITDR
jgi:hypothetical protein